MLHNTGMPVVNLVGQLPQDDMTRYSMAQIAREGQTPLLSDRAIRDRILALQDADQMDDAIKEQMAEQMLPEASLWSMLKAAERQGRDDLVEFYTGELMMVLSQKRKAAEALNAPPAPPMPPGMGGGPEGPMPPMGPPMGPPPMGPDEGPLGLSPDVMPPAMMGVPPPAPTPQAGPIVPPGSPRPGARGGA